MQARNEYEIEWRQGVNQAIRDLNEATSNLLSETRGLHDGQKALADEIRDMKQGPGKVRDWLALAVAIGAVLVALSCGFLSTLVQLWPHLHLN